MRFCSAKILDGSRQSTQPEIASALDGARQREEEREGTGGNCQLSWVMDNMMEAVGWKANKL